MASGTSHAFYLYRYLHSAYSYRGMFYTFALHIYGVQGLRLVLTLPRANPVVAGFGLDNVRRWAPMFLVLFDRSCFKGE